MAQHLAIEHTGISPSNATAFAEHNTGTPLPALLRLPRELRELIYEHCIRVDGGYIHNPEKGNLTQADGSPIALSLALVCRQTRVELEGLPFRLNEVTFTSAFSEATQREAAAHEGIIFGIMLRMTAVLPRLLRRLLTEEMAQTIAEIYPRLAPMLNDWRTESPRYSRSWPYFSCGEAPSIWHDFVHYVFSQLSRHPNFVYECQQAENDLDYLTDDFHGFQASELSRLHPQPWHILENGELSHLAPRFQGRHGPGISDIYDYKPGIKYTHSAAARAIRFLTSLPYETRQLFRSVILKEDCESVSYPAGHGRGFIPLCRENPKLHIRRIANLWKCVFSVTRFWHLQYKWVAAKPDQYEVDELKEDRLDSKTITPAVGAWIIEASVLPALGMPEGSFTLVLDGDPTAEYTSRVFQKVHQDVAWQTALDASYARGSLPMPSWVDRCLHFVHHYELLADAVLKLCGDDPLLQCNFDPSSPQSIDTLPNEHGEWSSREWEDQWESQTPRKYQTEPPLPPWHELRWQYVFGWTW